MLKFMVINRLGPNTSSVSKPISVFKQADSNRSHKVALWYMYKVQFVNMIRRSEMLI